jgi:hypothetical protein
MNQSASSTTVTATGQTGGTCQVSGPYRPSRNTSIVVFFKKGDKFPADPVDGRSTTWMMTS